MTEVLLSQGGIRVEHRRYMRLHIYADLFGTWVYSRHVYRNSHLIERRIDYYESRRFASEVAFSVYAELIRKGWRRIRKSNEKLDLRGLQTDRSEREAFTEALMSAETLEIITRRGTSPLRADLQALIDVIGMAFRNRRFGTRRRAGPDAYLPGFNDHIGATTSADDHARQRIVQLFAGIMAYDLDGATVAREVARMAGRGRPEDDAKVVRLIPRSRYAYLRFALDDFFHPDRYLKRVAYRLMDRGIWTVADLIRLKPAEVLACLDDDEKAFDALCFALAREEITLGASIPGAAAAHRLYARQSISNEKI